MRNSARPRNMESDPGRIRIVNAWVVEVSAKGNSLMDNSLATENQVISTTRTIIPANTQKICSSVITNRSNKEFINRQFFGYWNSVTKL